MAVGLVEFSTCLVFLRIGKNHFGQCERYCGKRNFAANHHKDSRLAGYGRGLVHQQTEANQEMDKFEIVPSFGEKASCGIAGSCKADLVSGTLAGRNCPVLLTAKNNTPEKYIPIFPLQV